MNRVQDKIVIVTGGASGLGLATVETLLREGAQVTLTDIDQEAGLRAARELGCVFFHQDVTDEDGWRTLVAQTVSNHGGLDVLVNNAGIGEGKGPSDLENATLADFKLIYNVNTCGTFLGCKYAIEAMRGSGGGSIINISSIAALVPTPFIAAYGASKAAVRQLTMSVAAHCAEKGYGIRCNSIHPGQILTPMLEGLFRDTAAAHQVGEDVIRGEFLKKIPLGEFGEPADIAHMALFLASDESRHITGAQMLVDGGMLVRA